MFCVLACLSLEPPIIAPLGKVAVGVCGSPGSAWEEPPKLPGCTPGWSLSLSSALGGHKAATVQRRHMG